MIQIVAGAAAAGALVGSLLAAWAVGTYKDATWRAATNQVKVEAAELLQVETDKVMKIEREANTKVRELEAQHVQGEKDLAVIQRRNRQLANELGGLRDPGRRHGSQDAVPTVAASTGSDATASASGYLSAEASEVLLNASAEVDALAEYARVCYEWKEVAEKSFTSRETP